MSTSKAELPEGAVDLMRKVAEVLLTSSIDKGSSETWDKFTKLMPQLLQGRDREKIKKQLLDVVQKTIKSPDVFGQFLSNLPQEARQSLMDRIESVFHQEFSRLSH